MGSRMSNQVGRSPTRDPDLAALALALDPDLMRRWLIQTVRLAPDQARHLTCSATVLKHKPGERCIIRYGLGYAGLAEPPNACTIIGKLYRKWLQAHHMYHWTRTLKNELFPHGGTLCIPEPLFLIPELALVLEEHVEGPDLRDAIRAGTCADAMSLAAQWLARLHTASPLPELQTKPLADELQNVHGWCDQIASCSEIARNDVLRLRSAQKALDTIASQMGRCTPVPIHRVFDYTNVLWDGRRIWVLDFDQLGLGDPALDVGNFLAHLESYAYHTTGLAHSFAEAGAHFLRCYLERSGETIRARLPFYRASTFLKLAATEVTRRTATDWPRLAQALTDLACREVNALSQARSQPVSNSPLGADLLP
jgi:aminoglycoside phosphotransferase (APT) family kinase protein